MNAVQKFLVSIAGAMSGSPSTSQEVSVVGTTTRLVPRNPSMVDRIVFLEGTELFDIGICKVKLDNMFRSSHFSICVIRECAELLGVSLRFTERSFSRLRALHCMDWGRMPKELADCVPELISEIFTEGAYPEPVGEIVSDQ